MYLYSVLCIKRLNKEISREIYYTIIHMKEFMTYYGMNCE